MAKKAKSEIIFPFYEYLWHFYDNNRKKIRQSYTPLTRKFLAYNDPSDGNAFLRQPQYEALEIYVFLKEYLGNVTLKEAFEKWRDGRDEFAGVDKKVVQRDQMTIYDISSEDYTDYYASMTQLAPGYTNYIFALTMGVGKTILMATMIFYEFLLANKYDKSDLYCHNAIVFAPDLTVLQSLKEIMTFDKSKVVPPEYAAWLDANLKFHFMDDSGMSLSVLDQSRYNIIISNTQKIILKQRRSKLSSVERLFSDIFTPDTQGGEYDDLYGERSDNALITNQRFEKLTRLSQIGIYVDEAHHAFGSKLEKDLLDKTAATSLRLTIDKLTEALEKKGTHVVGCYNYTGTPFVKKQLLPEVVYSYGLKDAIENQYLKRATVYGYSNVNTAEFVSTVLKEFFRRHGDKSYEGMRPKIAFFATTIDSLERDLKPEVEKVLMELGYDRGIILTNHEGASPEELYQFRHLDTPESDKQVILLVNKGKEGWNCRSLCSVALHRKPDSKIFVLQASMRCLRSLTDNQLNAQVYLSEENKGILEDELMDNFRLAIPDLGGIKSESKAFEVRPVPPPVFIRLKRVRRVYALKMHDKPQSPVFDVDEIPQELIDKYKVIVTGTAIEKLGKKADRKEDLTQRIRQSITYSRLTFTAEIARYLNESPLIIERILEASGAGLDKVISLINTYNGLLYDWVIPRIFAALYELSESHEPEEKLVRLVKEPPKGFFSVHNDPGLTVEMHDDQAKPFTGKSFHLDHYCFDSHPEIDLFWRLMRDGQIARVYFTGMLTHGQTEFRVSYIDPISHTVRYYYPDFLVQSKDGRYLIIEVKGDDKIDSEVVKAKAEFARLMATESGMDYQIIPGSKVETSPLVF